MALFYRITLEMPVGDWKPGDRLQVKNRATFVEDGEEKGGAMQGTMSLSVIRDEDGDIIPNVNPMVGEIIGGLNLMGRLRR